MNEPFVGHFEDIIVDEISLEGLEGITLEGLWVRLAEVLNVRLPLRWSICVETWNFIVKLSNHFQFYALPEPRRPLKIANRFELLSGDTPEHLIDACPTRTYKYNPIDENGIRGSCESYKERVEISHGEVVDKSLDEINERWGDKFIIVAVQHLRQQSLLLDTHVPWLADELQTQHFCVLERIGRARQYGEATIGRHSLISICNESVLIFYLRNRLTSLKLIRKQLYYEKSTSGSVLHLLRFPAPHLPIQLTILAESIQYLKDRNGMAEPAHLKAYIASRSDMVIKKFTKTTMFKKYISFVRVPFRTLYPDAKPEVYNRKNHKKTERIICALKLNDPNMTVDDILKEEEGDDEESTKYFLPKDNLYINVSVTEQVFELIKSYGALGVSQASLAKELGLRKLCMRRFIRKVMAIGLVGFYLKDVGRQRMRMYVVKKYLLQRDESALQDADVSIGEDEEVAAAFEPDPIKPPEYELLTPTARPRSSLEFSDKNEPDFKMTVKEWHHPVVLKRFTSTSTARQRLRRDLIMKLAKKTGVIDTVVLVRGIMSTERSLGYRDVICRKSLWRILQPMVDEKMVRIYDVQMQWRQYSKQCKLMCVEPINLDHKNFTDELLKVKETFFNGITMKKQKKASALTALRVPRDISEFVFPQRGNYRVGASKFIRAKLVHEILFHLVYVLKSDQQPLTFNEAARAWAEYDLSIDASALKHELPKVYGAEVNWTMFISPLPQYKNYPDGWICIKDFLMRIPLILLAKLHGIKDKADPELQEYLKHPIRRFYTIHGLSLDVRSIIRFDQSYASTIDQILRLLGYMGLVQYGPRLFKDPVYNFIYLNRNAIVFDTITSDPAYRTVSDDRDYPKMSFHFSSQTDIVEYWLTLQNICMCTKLGHRKRRDPSEPKITRFQLDLPNEVQIDEAPKKDIGYMLGNGRGAGGLDWTLFSHTMRNWDLSFPVKRKVGAEAQKAKSKMRCSAQKLPQRAVRHVFYKRSKKHIVMRRIRKVTYDDVDKQCLQRMDSLRVRWDHKEDRTLMICRVANKFLQGSTASKMPLSQTSRDILQWLLGSMQKSSRACQRRILYLLRSKANVNQVNSWFNELYQNEYVQRMYGINFFTQLKKYYRTVDQFSTVARIYFVQLVRYLVHLFNNTTIRDTEFIPDTLEQFNLLYRKTYDNNTSIKHFEPQTVDEVNESTINLLIHSSVCSLRDKMLYNMQLFEIYRSYDEGMIERCFRKVRFADQLVVAGKIQSRKKFPLLGKNVCISNAYRQQFICILPYLIYEQCHQSLEALLVNLYEKDCQNISYTCVNSGTSALLLELALIPGMNFDIQIPKQVLKFDPIHNSYNPDKIIHHFTVFNESTPEKSFANAISDTTRIQFNVNVSVHKIVYNPYDVFSRMSDCYLHFFCALQHLNTVVNVEVIPTRPFYCPFRCILQDADYLATIAQLIKEHESVIRQLAKTNKAAAAAATPSEDDPESKITTVHLTGQNLVSVVNRVQFVIRRMFREDMKKDIGLMPMLPQPTNMVQMALDALRCNNDMDGHISDEEDLLTERGDGYMRFQDYLVVNAPTLFVNFNEPSDDYVTYKDMRVHRSLLPGLDKKQAVLEKAVEDAIWMNQEYTVDDLLNEMRLLKFSEKEKHITLQLLSFIENSEIGVKATDLGKLFPNDHIIIKSLTVLRKMYLIKRVGVGSFVYVHRKKMRPWIIHSFHLKRYERESMTPQGDVDLEAAKRRYDQIEEASLNEPPEKCPRLEPEPSTSTGKRVSKPIVRYSETNFNTKDESKTIEKIKIDLRPAPWIRVNGSLNRRVFDKWIGTLLLECTIRSSIPVKKLFERFHQLHPVNILFLLECLKDLECVELTKYTSTPVTLFSEEENVGISKATELSNPEFMFVVVQPNALVKLSLFIGDKKYQIDF